MISLYFEIPTYTTEALRTALPRVTLLLQRQAGAAVTLGEKLSTKTQEPPVAPQAPRAIPTPTPTPTHLATSVLPTMDYEGLKEQWSEVEDRDGVRLSWNVFPSSRVVSPRRFPRQLDRLLTSVPTGSISSRRAYRRPVHTLEGEARHTSTPTRTHHL